MGGKYLKIFSLLKHVEILNITRKISQCIEYIFITPHINSLVLPLRCWIKSVYNSICLQYHCLSIFPFNGSALSTGPNIHAEKFGFMWLHPTGISSPTKAEIQSRIVTRTISVWPYMLQYSALLFFFPPSFFLSFLSVYISLLHIPVFLASTSLSCITGPVCIILFYYLYDSNTNSC